MIGEELPEDSRAETDPITDYPPLSEMPVSAVADWNGNDESGSVITYRTEHGGGQVIYFASGYKEERFWDGGTGEWFDWTVYLTQSIGDANYLKLVRFNVLADSIDQTDPLSFFFEGLSKMGVSGLTVDWGPNTTEAGHVITERNGSEGKQTFHQYSNATSYTRTYTASAWTAWTSEKVDLAAHLADTSDAHDASAISYAGGTGMSATDVEAAVDELATEKLNTADVQLAEDSRAETAAITAYPTGISVMKVSAAADWNEEGANGSVLTVRTGPGGHQTFSSEYESYYARVWNDGGLAWGPWISLHLPAVIVLGSLATDGQPESAGISSFPSGFTIMPVSGVSNWGPNTGEAGHVVIERNGSEGKQTFHQYSNGTSYTRTYTASAWSSWAAPGGWTAVDASETVKGIAEIATQSETNTGTDDTRIVTPLKLKTNLDLHINDTTDAHDASAISIADSANQYTATNAEDALAEVLDALQAHEADAVDAHDATAISYAGSTNLASTTVEAALDELDSEKASTGSVTSAISTHEAASDPHTAYQKESEKDANSGYIGRDANGGMSAVFHEYPKQAAGSPPAAPGSNGARLYTIDADGNTVLEGRTETGGRFRFLRDQLFIGRNNTGSSIAAGTFVRITGWDGTNGVITIAPADTSADSTMPAAGIVTAAISNNSSGRVWQIGLATGLNTSSITAGSEIYLTTSGGFTATKPTAVGARKQFLGTVLEQHASTGQIFVFPEPGYETIAASGSGLRSYVKLASAVNNGSTAANTFFDVTGLSFAVTSGVTYHFHAHLNYTSSGTANGARFSCNGPAFTNLFYVAEWTLTATSMATRNVQSTYNAGTVSATSSATGNICIIDGSVTPSASGTFILRAASELVGPANVISILAGSSLEYWTA
jgi:hypothetical protein